MRRPTCKRATSRSLGWFAFAGLWNVRRKPDGGKFQVFNIITTGSTYLIQST